MPHPLRRIRQRSKLWPSRASHWNFYPSLYQFWDSIRKCRCDLSVLQSDFYCNQPINWANCWRAKNLLYSVEKLPLDKFKRDWESAKLRYRIPWRGLSGSNLPVWWLPFLWISMKVMIPEDMASNKRVAFYERIGKTNRDVYDTWFFFNHGWKVNQELVERRTGMPYREFLETCCSLFEKNITVRFFRVREKS